MTKTNQTTPQLLREIADVMEERPEDYWRLYESQFSVEEWQPVTSAWDLFCCLGRVPLRRRPRTVKVSGEVPEEVLNMVRDMEISNPSGRYGLSDEARALIDLIENGGG